MDDLELDRELQTALTVAPSPEFAARVRTALAEPTPASMASKWLMPAGAIACAVVMAILAGLPREDARVNPRRTEATAAVAGLKPGTTNIPPSNTNIPPTTTNVQPSTTSIHPATPNAQASTTNVREITTNAHAANIRTALVPTLSAGTANEPPLPEVIIAPDDVDALRQFVTGAREVRFVASFDEAPASTEWAITELRILPITIEPLDPAPAHNN